MSRESYIRTELLHLPMFLQLFGISALAMMVPAVHAISVENHNAARAFFYAGLLGIVVFLMMAVVRGGMRDRQRPLGPLLSLFCAFVFLPVYFAVPFVEALPTTRFLNAYVEMVSAMTTTGATMFQDPGRLSGTLHLWRAQVGWMGGLLMWVAAAAILAPLHLGGFEVTAQAEPGRRDTDEYNRMAPINARKRLQRTLTALFPIYAGLTLLLCLLLLGGGEVPLTALCHAMSVMATSGISPIGGVQNAPIGVTGEAVMLLFMLFALSRLTFSKDTVTATQGGLMTDPEFRIGIFITLAVPAVIFARHFLGAYDVAAMENVSDAGFALWGSVFTVLSFLTTTGFVSEHWDAAQNWSGLNTPGLVLMGLALTGGGVATTAGGVKLLRVFALYLNGTREMERLVHPNSVSGAGAAGRRLQSNGAFIAWIFFMLFAISLAAVMLALTLAGSSFEQALVLAVASLSTTGPLTQFAADVPIRLIELSTTAKAIFCAAMVLGRLETLAIIALLTPDLWRN
ncbi:Trk system potassium uptake protein [Sulfitobacter noctilucicola]|uniref:Trk system potassium uptake protein TrkH n=1 Tax=Sulfitobacter noctilucicola TaxID=1342301 RepID=A0A7W6M7A0_9RHOB|nr:potassium transporter TrkG [Sulfitobacter noctilucicola]KIN65139.1 Trk system potassium uptake protein [Sulfitobacter noctilucicola]MBB4173726.1 trk system potassium uptake protein TrkH [Sulfitobacter noctilucicola]